MIDTNRTTFFTPTDQRLAAVSFRTRGLGGLIAATAAAVAIGISVASPAAADPVGGCTTPYGTYQNCSQ